MGDGGQTSGVRRLLSGAARFVRERPAAQKIAAAVVVVALAVAPFGVYRPAPEPGPQTLPEDEPVQVGPFEVTVAGVGRVAEYPAAYLPSARRNQVLVIAMAVTNTSDRPESSTVLSNVVRVDGDAGRVREEGEIAPPSVMVDGSDTNPDVINPGVTYDLVYAWEQRGDWKGDSVPVVLERLQWIEESALSLDNQYWLDTDEAHYSADLPVKELK